MPGLPVHKKFNPSPMPAWLVTILTFDPVDENTTPGYSVVTVGPLTPTLPNSSKPITVGAALAADAAPIKKPAAIACLKECVVFILFSCYLKGRKLAKTGPCR
jgi:hypothetical protein